MSNVVINPEPPTQTRHPWRATVRTVLAALLGLTILLPQIVDAAGLSGYGWAAGAVAVAGAVTRVLAVPGVDGWLRRHMPWLGTQPPEPPAVAALRERMAPRR